MGRVQSVDNVDNVDNDFKSLAYNICNTLFYKNTNLLYICYSLSTLSTIKPALAFKVILHCPQTCPHIVHNVHKLQQNVLQSAGDAISHHLVK
jgi:hypothetical protein